VIRGTVNAQPALDYLEEIKLRTIDAIEVGMEDAMASLASSEAAAAPLQTGRLRSWILRSPRVKRTQRFISGTVNANVGPAGPHNQMFYIGNYLEFGTSVPAVVGKLMVFVAVDGTPVFTRKHKAFQVGPHPFMNATLHARKDSLMEIIAQYIREAID
jgi:hypothetical protein